MTEKSTRQAGNLTSGNSKASQSESSLVHATSNKDKSSWLDGTQVKKRRLKKQTYPLPQRNFSRKFKITSLPKPKLMLQEKTTAVQTYEEFKSVLCDKGGFVKAAWCGSADDEAKIKDETGATIRVRPFQTEDRDNQLRLLRAKS